MDNLLALKWEVPYENKLMGENFNRFRSNRKQKCKMFFKRESVTEGYSTTYC